jgi:hypothetical protein
MNNFRENVNALNRMHPSWNAGNIADFLNESADPPTLSRKCLVQKIRRQLKRGTVSDKHRSGHPVTVSTPNFQKKLLKAIRLKKGASIRNTNSSLIRGGLKSSYGTVWRNVKKLKLIWHKKRKSQKLNDAQKMQRVLCAKRLRRKYGTKSNNLNYKWNRVVNTDFSGKFTLAPFQNKRNDGIWAKEDEKEISASLINAPSDKFQKGIIFWGAISSRGLIPSDGPINFSKWLKTQKQKKQGKSKSSKTWLTGELYAKFVRQKIAHAINVVFNDETPIFQDDQDNKQRTKVALDEVDLLFDERIQPFDGDAKLADVWRIENVWGMLKEKLRGKKFSSEKELEKEVRKHWRKLSVAKCKQMMEEIPNRLKKVIDSNGEHIHEH